MTLNRFAILNADGLIVGQVWADSMQKQSNDPKDKGVWLKRGTEIIAAAWYGTENLSDAEERE